MNTISKYPGEGEMSKELLQRPIPIYNTHGDCAALIISPHIYNLSGEWIGWVTPEMDVFDVDGFYVGWLSEDMRVLRKRNQRTLDKRDPPDPPKRVRAPATIPLPPMMAELPYGVIDVLDEEPERLHTIDTGELKEDMN
jgi:hypothetical protein